MSNLAIQADNLSKKYQIGLAIRHDTLRDHIAQGLRTILLRNGRRSAANGQRSASSDILWALRDVSLRIERGEVVGIIGRNGAGKSTLLKILSRITEPTSGSAKIYGRVGSLLEVGTGFHGELTGRENIYLNGAILGMKRSEIQRKFDEIVAFSEIDKFLDTPVKRYSSGMYVRLAFAVAAHLEPEILIVDEVLAVGDAAFQKKCLNRMQAVGQQGQTVIFVSHSMPAITRLCKRVILLDNGTVLQDGPAHRVVGAYLQSGLGLTAVREYSDPKTAPGNDIVRVRAVRVRSEDGRVSDVVDIRQQIGIDMEFEVLKPGQVLVPCYGFNSEEGVCIFISSDRDPDWRRRPRPIGRYVSTAWIPGNLLSEGTITVGAGIITEDPFKIHCDDEHAVAFQVSDSLDGDTARGDFGGRIPGVVRPLLKWTTEFAPTERATPPTGSATKSRTCSPE
jgi:lipopolysaccharide transport system ATP-binding protein